METDVAIGLTGSVTDDTLTIKTTGTGAADDKKVVITGKEGAKIASDSDGKITIEAPTYTPALSNTTLTLKDNNNHENSLTKTYKISGTAWLDSNENGMRDADEKIMSGISAKLVNSESGVIQKAVTTDSTGGYTFSGVENGNYLVEKLSERGIRELKKEQRFIDSGRGNEGCCR